MSTSNIKKNDSIANTNRNSNSARTSMDSVKSTASRIPLSSRLNKKDWAAELKIVPPSIDHLRSQLKLLHAAAKRRIASKGTEETVAPSKLPYSSTKEVKKLLAESVRRKSTRDEKKPVVLIKS
jgi:hypothetical protein